MHVSPQIVLQFPRPISQRPHRNIRFLCFFAYFFQPTDSPSSPAFGYTPLSASGGTADSPAYSPSHSVTSPGFSPTSPACKYQERSEVNRRAEPPPLPDPNPDPRNPFRPACPCRLAYRFELERSARPNADVGRRRIQSKLEWRRGRVAHIDECGEPARRWGRKVWPWRIQPDEVGGGKLDFAGLHPSFFLLQVETRKKLASAGLVRFLFNKRRRAKDLSAMT